jgi:formate dehydrogenase subunit beta
VAVGLAGVADELPLTFAASALEAADRLRPALGLEDAPAAAWPGAEALLAARAAGRAAVLAEARAALAGPGQLAATFAACVRCGNCSTACPMCYCRECLFRSATFERPLDDLVRLAGRKGAVRLPADTALYHLTRMSHVAASCVGCGLCEEACPNDVPLARLFAAAARSRPGGL